MSISPNSSGAVAGDSCMAFAILADVHPVLGTADKTLYDCAILDGHVLPRKALT